MDISHKTQKHTFFDPSYNFILCKKIKIRILMMLVPSQSIVTKKQKTNKNLCVHI